MRFSFSHAVTLLLLVEQVVGFSSRILPVSSGSPATTLLQQSAKPQEAPPTSTDDMQKILSTLEKRVKEGPGSLSLVEVEQLKIGSNRLLLEMKKKETQQAQAVSAAPTAPVQNQAPAPTKKVATPKKEITDRDLFDLQVACSHCDAAAVTTLINAGVEMDEETTNTAFWAVVQAVDRAEAQDQALPVDVPQMLHHIFDADLRHLLTREKVTTNVTCMQPKKDSEETNARAMNYIFDDMAHKDLPLMEGRVCADGRCCDACSRNVFPTFATEAECDLETFPELKSLTFNDLKTVSAATILQFTRLVERVRRTMAHEYGLPLHTILPLQAYSRKYVAGTTQQGGGGGEGDFVTLHTDESTHEGYHYSSVLYLSTQGEDFEGGDFVFNDPKPKVEGESEDTDENEDDEDEEELLGESLYEEIRRTGRVFTPFHPSRGAAVIFSSGWENMHEVERITSGTRYAVPCFFTTCPVPEAHYDQMVVGKPKTDIDIADDWLHLLLAHRNEAPMESMGRVKELLMKWHYICTPLDQH